MPLAETGPRSVPRGCCSYNCIIVLCALRPLDVDLAGISVSSQQRGLVAFLVLGPVEDLFGCCLNGRNLAYAELQKSRQVRLNLPI